MFTLSFMTLRSFTGGFHCDGRLFCYISSSLVLFIPVYTDRLFVRMSVPEVLVTLAAAAGIILVLSPMHSKNRKLDQKEKKHFGRRARVTVVLQIMVFFVLWHMGYNDCAVYSGICIIYEQPGEYKGRGRRPLKGAAVHVWELFESCSSLFHQTDLPMYGSRKQVHYLSRTYLWGQKLY